jgi:two-component system NtrC family sensor kinase
MEMKARHMELSLALHQIIQTLMEGVFIEDNWGRLVLANQTFEQLLGYEPEEAVGLHWTALIPEEFHGKLQAFRLAGSADSTSRYKVQLQRKDGSRIWVLLSARTLFEGSERQGTLSAFIPLESHEHYPPEEMALLGQHVSSVAHELNNPLTIILLQTRLLQNSVSTPQISSSLATIQGQTRRMMRLVDDLLSSAGSRPLQLETTDVNALIQHTLDLQNLSQAHTIQIVSDLAADLPPTQADPDRLQQIFDNVIRNARQAIEAAHDATASAERGPGRVTVTTTLLQGGDRHRPRIQIRVSDNGPGIPPEVMPHIFEPFFTTKRGSEGTGLGLSICDQIAREHGGDIWAENNNEGGATFILELPVIGPLQQDRPGQANRCPLQEPRPAASHLAARDNENETAEGSEPALKPSGFRRLVATAP